ncbi:MAG: hypothetical protein ABJQ39_05855 [Winogradskyella arenosi]
MNPNILAKVAIKGLAALVALGASVRLAKESNNDREKLKNKK